MDLGQRISVIRGQWSNARYVPDVSTVRHISVREICDPRRSILALAEKSHIYGHNRPESQFFSSKTERETRRSSPDALLARIEMFASLHEESRPRYEWVLTELWLEVLRILGTPSDAHVLFNRVCCLLGFRPSDVLIRDGNVIIRDATGFCESAASFTSRTLAR